MTRSTPKSTSSLHPARFIAQLIDLMTEAARKMDVDFVSGGERRDFFFSMPVARKLGLGHLSIFKDLSSVYTDANGVSMPSEAGKACPSKRSVHIADLVDGRFLLYPRMDSRRRRVWAQRSPVRWPSSIAIRAAATFSKNAGCPLTTLIVIKPELFETAHQHGTHHRQAACARAAFHRRSGCLHARVSSFAHPNFLAEEIAKGGKSAQRAQLCISSGFAPAEALPKA